MTTLGAAEYELVTPLDGEEIKLGIAAIVADAVKDRLDKIGYLYGQAYPKFKAEIRIHIDLENFGLTQPIDTVAQASNLSLAETMDEVNAVDIEVEVPFTPPNQFRRENDLEVPTQVPSRPSSGDEATIFKARRGRPAGKR